MQSPQLLISSIKSIHSTLSGRYLPIVRYNTFEGLGQVVSASATCEACMYDVFAAASRAAAGQLLAPPRNLVAHAGLLIILHGVIPTPTEGFEEAHVIQTVRKDSAWALSEKGQRAQVLTQSTHEHQLRVFSHYERRRPSSDSSLGQARSLVLLQAAFGANWLLPPLDSSPPSLAAKDGRHGALGLLLDLSTMLALSLGALQLVMEGASRDFASPFASFPLQSIVRWYCSV